MSFKSTLDTTRKVMQGHARAIKKRVNKRDLGIRVSEEVQIRDASWFDRKYVLGGMSFSKEIIAYLASSNECEDVEMIMFAPIPNKSVMLDSSKQAVGTYSFFGFEKGQIVPIITTKRDSYHPIRVHAINESYYPGSFYEKAISNIALKSFELKWLTEDKVKTKKVLERKEISIPRGFEPPDKLGASLEWHLRSYFGDERFRYPEFVIKKNNGCGGSGIRMFEIEEVEDAIKYALDLKKPKGILVEERKIPLNWQELDEKGNKYYKIDWNIRFLVVAYKDKTAFIDMVCRYKRKDREPVNVSKGCKSIEVEKMPLDSTIMNEVIPGIKENALKSCKVAYDCTNNCYNERDRLIVFGGDMIVSLEQKKYVYTVYELNCGPIGGFGTLYKLRKAPIKGISKVFLPLVKEFMIENSKIKNPDFSNGYVLENNPCDEKMIERAYRKMK